MNLELISTIMVSDFSEDIRIRHYHHQNFPVKLQNVLPPQWPGPRLYNINHRDVCIMILIIIEQTVYSLMDRKRFLFV